MQSKNKTQAIIVVLLLIFILYFYNILPSVLSWGPSGNYENVSVRTTVNVTQAYPEVLNVTCNNDAAIDLSPGSTQTITCLIEIRDYNGGSEINNTNGTFYYYLNESSDPDDNNTHYANSTCTENNTNSYYTNWTCAFDLLYYANNGTWIGNFTVIDDYNMTDTGTGNASINTLYALNVTELIDFGNMAVGDTYTSNPPPSANVTNFGNMNINVSVYGFGGEDEILYAGLAMVCEQRNLTLPNERYSINSTELYADMTSVTGSATHIAGLTVIQQTNDSQQVINATYWRLHVNVTTNPFGECNGTVVFAAEVP
ncbi:hypothetical protein KY348_03575 [Candidatus Woesearchaeota archaeon]|nr:hypothetical protein [Candidatus Woesearchaeota archaeon]